MTKKEDISFPTTTGSQQQADQPRWTMGWVGREGRERPKTKTGEEARGDE